MLSEIQIYRQEHGLCRRCGKPAGVNPNTQKHYVMCPSCRERDRIRNHIAYHRQREERRRKQMCDKRGAYDLPVGGSGLSAIYNNATSDYNTHRCPSCKIKVRDEFYFCPWCGAGQAGAE